MSIHDVPDEVLRRGDVACTILCHMVFKTNPQRWWVGYGPLSAGGKMWQGTGDVIKISSLNLTYGMSAGMVRFSIPNASPEMIARCDNQEDEVNGRRVQLLYQLFSTQERDGQQRNALIGDPISVFVGRMKDMTSTSTATSREIELECYGRMSQQGKPPFGRWTDMDQKIRYPGDRGLEFMPTLKDKATTWIPGD